MLQLGAAGGLAALLPPAAYAAAPDLAAALRAAEQAPVLQTALLREPAILKEITLLHLNGQYWVRVRDEDGVEGIALTNPRLMATLWPIFLKRVAPSFLGKDARQLEALQTENYAWQLNYKWQGLAYWCAVAWMELAILDLLGKKAGRPVGALLGGRVRESSGIYYASGNRGNTPQAELAHLERLVEEAGAKALKFRLGARLHHDAASTARDLALIPAVRARFGPDFVLYADANSSYDVPMSLRIGRLLEAEGYAFFEEPVRFDHYEEMKEVADALSIPIAFGEEEASLARFRWVIAQDAAQVLQPDLLYGGGLIRAIKVARMAAVRGYPCVPHISGDGLGSLYALHFASCVENTTPYQEYKGEERVAHEVAGVGGPLRIVGGRVAIPAGPGLGVAFDPADLAKAQAVRG
jgi:L-alanine-DL-glutamate epimerase-like enolase superfamily enzyme